MSKSKRSQGKSAPTYRLHKGSGQAVVRIGGKIRYLGKYDSPESRERYRRAIAEEWKPAGTAAPQELASVDPKQDPSTITITELAVIYAAHAKSYYRKNDKPTSEWPLVRLTLKKLRSLYGSMKASEFGPLKYQAFRQTFIDAKLARKTINSYMFHVRAMFRHAAKMELIPMEWFWRLKEVGNLIEGRSDAKETDDIMPANDDIVDKTLKELTPTVSAMVKLQRLTGMRPGEVIQLRPCDIDRSSDVWLYRPPSHKNQHKKSRIAKTRTVAFGPMAQRVLTPFLLRDHQAFCFTPSESFQQHQDERRRKRTTPDNQGNRPGYNGSTRSKVKRTRNFAACFSTSSYRNAVRRAALRAFPKPEEEEQKKWESRICWNPNQLRHSAATKARKVAGLETAQQVCGHTQKRTTENTYAEIDLTRAVEFARKFG
jgi:integrase